MRVPIRGAMQRQIALWLMFKDLVLATVLVTPVPQAAIRPVQVHLARWIWLEMCENGSTIGIATAITVCHLATTHQARKRDPLRVHAVTAGMMELPWCFSAIMVRQLTRPELLDFVVQPPRLSSAQAARFAVMGGVRRLAGLVFGPGLTRRQADGCAGGARAIEG